MTKVVGVRVPPPAPSACRRLPDDFRRTLFPIRDLVRRTTGAGRQAGRRNILTIPARQGRTNAEEDDDAGHRNPFRGTEARIQGQRSRDRSRRQGGCAPGRSQGQGPPQRLPSRQGAGGASEEDLRPLRHGRDHRPDHPRHQHADFHRTRLPPRFRAQGDDADREEGGRRAALRQDRSHLHGRDRSGAADHARRFQELQCREAGRRGQRRRRRRSDQAHRRPEPALCGESRRRQGREGRPRHHQLQGHHRRRRLRRRHR